MVRLRRGRHRHGPSPALPHDLIGAVSRIHRAQRALLLGTHTGGIRPAAPEVDDEFSIDPRGHCGAHLATVGEVTLELLPDSLELGHAEPSDRDLGGVHSELAETCCRHHPSIAPADAANLVRDLILSRSRNRTVIQTTFGIPT